MKKNFIIVVLGLLLLATSVFVFDTYKDDLTQGDEVLTWFLTIAFVLLVFIVVSYIVFLIINKIEHMISGDDLLMAHMFFGFSILMILSWCVFIVLLCSL